MTPARVTVIDQARGIAPRAFDRQGLGARDPLAAARLAKLETAAEGRDAEGILRLALTEEFRWPDRRRLVLRFGVGGAAAHGGEDRSDDAGPLPQHRQAVRRDVALSRPAAGRAGPDRYPHHRAASRTIARDSIPKARCGRADTDACCDFRKVIPVKRALQGFAAQITGRKRFQTSARAEMQTVEYFDGRFRFNPLADWTLADLEAYTAEHEMPRHPLVEDGYPSIGCMPCTRRVQGRRGLSRRPLVRTRQGRMRHPHRRGRRRHLEPSNPALRIPSR